MALMDLSEQDLAQLQGSVRTLLDYFRVMSKIDVSSLSPTTHAHLEGARVRPDVEAVTQSDELLELAPDLEDRYISIPNIL